LQRLHPGDPRHLLIGLFTLHLSNHRSNWNWANACTCWRSRVAKIDWQMSGQCATPL
jgi:hypothetical protein